ncbi:TonB-dependent receptor [Croceicoccus sp. F390]|uniref:TonB-dependent receptor n=1 Tax=Croceicoccus esteveae TaxID=3075597 RepID=A0ABU2ZGI6_9SPHN|nr:TonB-dependent receptor [Croceicoccus sp. F390]MDT0575698.1 TonB-dependent receptor [Croceicoccus sp. F390]
MPDTVNEATAVADLGDNAIVVTGSRIKRTRFDTKEPTLVIGEDLFEEQGYTNVGEALETLPAFGPPDSNAVGSQAGSFGSGQSFINFFGLGSQRTLTLVNGRRYVSSNTASIFGPVGAGTQVDLNTIPTLLIDRIETVAVGAAPIYGSDAIAGTVNIILKDEFDGIELNGQYGIAEEGDAEEYRLSALAGKNFGGGRGNVVAAFEYNKTGGLLFSDRKQTSRGLFFAAPADPDYPFRNQLIEDRRIPVLGQFGIPAIADTFPGFGADFTNAAGDTLVFNREGNLVPLDFGTPTGSIVNASGGDGFSLVPVSNLRSPVERYLGNLQVKYEVTDTTRVFLEGSYANSKGTELRSQPVYNTALFDDAGTPDGALIIPLDNPFLSDEARQLIASQLPDDQDFFYLGRANTNIIAGEGSSTVELYRIAGGLEGDLSLFERGFAWELVGNYGKSKTKGNSRELVQGNFVNALNGCSNSGSASPIETVSSTCVPFNPFGNQNSQAVADYITTVAKPIATNEQWVVTASVTGSLLDVWAGGVDFALGYEHRDETADFDPGQFFFGQVNPDDPDGPRQSFGRSVPIDPVNGGYNTDEIFGELLIPLVAPDMEVPFVNRLEISGAARYVDNSLTGGDLTWTAGGRFNPVRDLGIRGNFTRSIRAPAVTELFNPTSNIFTLADDPCDARFIDSGPNPANRAANCAADGLPGNFVSNIVDFTTEGVLAGNTGLQNEKADSWTVGVVFTPTFLRGLQWSADWVEIDLSDAIVSLNAEQTLNACYDAVSFPAPACEQIDRDDAGQVDFIRTGYVNAASYSYKGLISEMNWRIDTPFIGADSTINLRGSYQYLDELRQEVGTGDLTILRGDAGYSKHQATASITYNNDDFGAFVQGRYIGPAQIDPNAPDNAYDVPGPDSVVFVDASVRFNVEDMFTLRLITENIFDTNAPYPVPAGGGIVTYFDGIMGRYFKVSATTRF